VEIVWKICNCKRISNEFSRNSSCHT